MVETVLVLPILMVVIVLIVYLGWNLRRLEKVTAMDRYSAWQLAMPGSPGPARDAQSDHDQLNDAFFADNSDRADELEESYTSIRGPIPDAHELLLTELIEEDFAYFQNFLEDHPATTQQRFNAEHEDISPLLDLMGMSNLTSNRTGHRVLNGDWRFADGIRFNSQTDQWEPGSRRIAPTPALSDVFFAQFDEEITAIANGDNPLATATRDFYTRYPGYTGPEINTSWSVGDGWE